MKIKNKLSQFMKLNIFLVITLSFLLSCTTVYADDSNTRSIVGDFFNKVFEIKLTNGKGMLEGEADINEREEINQKILEGTSDKTYSLYDRFGGNIRFIPYFGETKISTNLLDRFYDKFSDNDAEFELSLDDIKKFFEKPAISNNVIYEGRPNVLSDEDITGGAMDPRVAAYSGISATGGSAAIGNSMLSVSSIITELVAWLSGSGLYNTINNIWNNACEAGIEDILQSMVKFLLPLAMCGFVIRLVSSTMKALKGTYALRNLIIDLSCSLISLGLIFSLMYNPTAFGNAFTKVTTIIDTVLDDALQIGADEVVASDQTKNVRIAVLWKKSVFNQWCDGMFGDSYNHLYTTFDQEAQNETGGKKVFNQSNDDITAEWNSGETRFNSAALTGDIKIPIGNGVDIRNWAALAWSTQSIYHIDAVETENTEMNSDAIDASSEGKNIWPRALLTPMNDQIYVDNFRWLDAKLNISPQYKAPDDVTMSYTDSRNYDQNFVSAGGKSIYMALLLLPIGYLAIRKIFYVFLLVSGGVKLCLQSIGALFWPQKYNLLQNLKNLLKPMYEYLWWSIIIFLAITIYDLLTGHTFIVDFVWIIISIWLIKMKPIRTPRQVYNTISYLGEKAKSFGRKALNVGKSIIKK